jgi:hypothetical protein
MSSAVRGGSVTVIRKYSVRHLRAPASTRDATRPTPIARARAYPPPIDVGIQAFGRAQAPPEGPERQDPTHYEGACGCSDSSTLSESSANAPQTSVSSNPGTPDVPFRFPVRKSHWPSGSAAATWARILGRGKFRRRSVPQFRGIPWQNWLYRPLTSDSCGTDFRVSI